MSGARAAGAACVGCAHVANRRQAVQQISAAALAALAGVALRPETAAALPVVEAPPIPVRPGERGYALPAADGVTIDRVAQVILVRFQQKAYAFNLACPHENTALRWRERDARFQCPRHESQYQPDGTFLQGRATRNMDRFAIRLVDAKLLVDLDRLYRSDLQANDWSQAAVSV